MSALALQKLQQQTDVDGDEASRGVQTLRSEKTARTVFHDTSSLRRLRIGTAGFRLLLGVSCGVLLLALPPVSAEAQEAADPTLPAEEGAPEVVEGPDVDEETQRSAERFLFPETSLAKARIGSLTSLRSSTFLPPNVLQNVSRPDNLLRVGSFAIQSSVALAAAYDDNAEASDTDREGEFGGTIAGSLRAQSLFERHKIGAQVNVVSAPFNRDDDEELIDWSLGADGQLDLTPRSSLSAAVAGTYGTEDIESAEASESLDATGDEVTVADIAATVVYAQRLNRAGLALSGGVGRIEADANGSDVNDEADERDRTTYSVGLGLDYTLSRRLGLFSEVEYELSDFDIGGDGGSRDAQTVDGSVGVEMELGRTLAARLGAGYSTVFFDDSERSTEEEITVEAALDGAISLDRVTVLGLSLTHETEQTTVEDAALATTTTLAGSLSRALSRKSAVQATAEGSRSDFLDTDRTDYDVSAQLAYSLALTRSLSLNASYRFSQRFSDEDENEFYRNIVAIGIQASF